MNKLVKNYLYNLGYQILMMVLPLITTPYLSRVLKADGVGKYNYAYSIVSVAVIIAQLGSGMYGQREIAYLQNERCGRSRVFWSILCIRTITSLIIIPMYVLLALHLNEYTTILLSMVLYLIANMADVSWFFQGMEDFRKLTIRSTFIKVLGVALIFLLVKNEYDVILYSIILSGSQVLGNLVLWIYVPNYVNSFDWHKSY